MDNDDLLMLERRYTVRLNSNNQREAYQLAMAATLDVPRLVATLQQVLAERDAALAERDALRAEVVQAQAQLAPGGESQSNAYPMQRRWWSTRAWWRKPQVPAA